MVLTMGGCVKFPLSREMEGKAAGRSQQRTASMSQDLVREAKQVIKTVAQAPEFTKKEIEKLLGVKLVHSPDALPQFNYYEGDLPGGPFGRVEVREPNPSQDKTWLVDLTVREGVELPLAEFEKDAIGPNAEMDVEPRVPPEGLVTYSVKDSAQSIHFGFRARSRTLQQVALHRPGN
jgi:hypothetical protein